MLFRSADGLHDLRASLRLAAAVEQPGGAPGERVPDGFPCERSVGGGQRVLLVLQTGVLDDWDIL